MYRDRYVSVDCMYQMREEHYRCVVVTDYRVGRQEQRERESAFLDSFARYSDSVFL